MPPSASSSLWEVAALRDAPRDPDGVGSAAFAGARANATAAAAVASLTGDPARGDMANVSWTTPSSPSPSSMQEVSL